MKRIYANLLGVWTEVTYNSVIVGKLADDEGEASEFVRISTNDASYSIPKSCIQLVDDDTPDC